MHSVLQPPNSQNLSDNVIGGVTLRTKPVDRHCIDGSQSMNPQWSIVPTTKQPVNDNKRPMQSLESTSLQTSKIPKSSDKFLVDQLLEEQKRLRELRRMRQIRYRKKKDNYAITLEEETRKMRNEIEKLEQRQRSLTFAVPTKESVWSVATEYFRLFRFGLNTMTSTSQPSPQHDFVYRTMARDVVFNSNCGPEAMMKSWKYLSLWFQDVELELDELKTIGVRSLVATTTTSVTITERTLRNVFHHLLSNEQRELSAKLLNQRIVMRGSVRFVWDTDYCRVSGVFAQSDWLTPMSSLLGSLEDTSRVLEKALISPDFQWRTTTT